MNIIIKMIDNGMYPKEVITTTSEALKIMNWFCCSINFSEKMCVVHYNTKKGEPKNCVVYW